MATFPPNIVRAVSIDVKDATLELYLELLPLFSETNSWIVHCQNSALPDPFAVKVALEQYQELKPRSLELQTWIETIKTAEPDDTIEYTAPCEGMAGPLIIPTATGLTIPTATGITFPQ